MTTSAKVDSEEANKSGIGKKNKQEKTVLICGASIAGPALALFLTRMQKSQSQWWWNEHPNCDWEGRILILRAQHKRQQT
jgi:hypothetical protein